MARLDNLVDSNIKSKKERSTMKTERCSTIMTSILLTMEQTLTMMSIKWMMMTLTKTGKVDHSIDRQIIWEQQIMIKNK